MPTNPERTYDDRELEIIFHLFQSLDIIPNGYTFIDWDYRNIPREIDQDEFECFNHIFWHN